MFAISRRPRNRSSELGSELTRYETDRERLELAKKTNCSKEDRKLRTNNDRCLRLQK